MHQQGVKKLRLGSILVVTYDATFITKVLNVIFRLFVYTVCELYVQL